MQNSNNTNELERPSSKKILATVSVLLATAFIATISYNLNDTSEMNISRRLQVDDACESIQPLQDFSIEEFASKPWFAIKQRETTMFQPVEVGCVEARYSFELRRWWHKFLGWDVSVDNYGEYPDGEEAAAFLCAKILDEQLPSALAVAPCFLPSFFFSRGTGSYWVVVYNETAGYAVISNGQPSIDVGDGTCVNEEQGGFWIFSRERNPTENQTNTAIDEAEALGFNIDTLTDFYDIDQTNCNRPPP